MKKTLLFLVLACATGAQAQQKLIGNSLYYYDNNGTTQYIDSSSYQYPSSDGSLTSSEPIFQFDNPIFDWTFELPLILCGSESTFIGSSLPLTPSGISNYTITAGKVTQTETVYDRTVYSYNTSGNTTSIERYTFNGTSWDQMQNETFEYDANQNMIVRNIYDYPSGTPENVSRDSMTYNASNQVISATNYAYDQTAGQWYAYNQSIITYSGTEVSNIQILEGDISAPLEQTYDIDYTYTAGKPTKFDAYEVIAGQPQTPALVVYDYTYGANQKISTIEGTFSGDLMEKREFTYDAQGFLTRLTKSDLDFSTSMLYVYSASNYYYASTAGVDENAQAILSVYPNPVNDVLMISTTEKVENVKVFSVNGKIMIEQTSNSVDVSALPSGSYIAQVQTATGVSQTRFVKN